MNHSVNINITAVTRQMKNIHNRSGVTTKTGGHLNEPFLKGGRKKNHIMSLQLQHCDIDCSPNLRLRNWPPEIKMSDCQSRWCHWPHLSPSVWIAASTRGLGCPWDTVWCRHPTNPLSLQIPPFRAVLHQCQEPCRQEAKRMAVSSFPSKRKRARAGSCW